MAHKDIIREYLVKLGFDLDVTAQRKFDDALRRAGTSVTKIAGSMTKDFTIAGGAILSALTGVTTATVGLMNNVAKNDLQFQIFARRMYLGADAAKKMKIATDALGYSLEDIIWGPPELAERYGTLIKDQDRMLKNLGGPEFAKSMRNLRDIRFEFTRMGVEVQYLGMQITKSIMDKLFGGPEALDRKLDRLNVWFQTNIPRIADQLGNVLAPVLSRLGQLADAVFTQRNVDWTINMLTKGSQGMSMTFDMLGRGMTGPNNWVYGQNGLYDSGKSFNENMNTLVPGLFGETDRATSKAQLMGNIIKKAREAGVDPAVALALFDQESSFVNRTGPRITNPKSRYYGQMAQGLGQVMPGNAPGVNLMDPDTNIAVSLGILKRNLAAHGGNLQDAMHDYYGHDKPMPGQPTFEQYWSQYQQKMKTYSSDPSLKPMSYNVDVGGIHITQPGATPDQIKKAVLEGIDAAQKRESLNAQVRAQGAFA